MAEELNIDLNAKVHLPAGEWHTVSCMIRVTQDSEVSVADLASALSSAVRQTVDVAHLKLKKS